MNIPTAEGARMDGHFSGYNGMPDDNPYSQDGYILKEAWQAGYEEGRRDFEMENVQTEATPPMK